MQMIKIHVKWSKYISNQWPLISSVTCFEFPYISQKNIFTSFILMALEFCSNHPKRTIFSSHKKSLSFSIGVLWYENILKLGGSNSKIESKHSPTFVFSRIALKHCLTPQGFSQHFFFEFSQSMSELQFGVS